ncbi:MULTISPECIES: hypothetical protein [unclassified Leptolyngbya]|uniref:hypothetical protein n=1 Tax=unclassified Leptolyngbya TaxID=2650499 RepID=UPI001F55A8C4|nr:MULTISPECIES: hypothetical protein [unclassified Leptolyngbya]
MPSPVDSQSSPTVMATLPEQDARVSYSNSIVGAAIFDLSGLPKEYFTTSESSDVSWVQTIFQALGLQSLLISSLRLEGFRHAVIHGQDYLAVVVRQRVRYMALLVRKEELQVISEGFLAWSLDFEPSILRTHPRFSAV